MNNVAQMYLKTEILCVFPRTSLTLSESTIMTKINFEDVEISQGYGVLIQGFQRKSHFIPLCRLVASFRLDPSNKWRRLLTPNR